jgi:uncharacterized protein (TIGR03435 family)
MRNRTQTGLAPVVAALGAILIPQLTAQAPLSGPVGPALEVASIKPAASGARAVVPRDSPDTYSRRNTFVRALVQDAFNVLPFQIFGIPPALDASARFDVTAKASFQPTSEQRRQMLQRLLADRFALQSHHETREMQVYALRLGKDFGQPGKQFKRTSANCEEVRAARTQPADTPAPQVPPDPLLCSGRFLSAPSTVPNVHLIGRGITVNDFVPILAGFVGRVVIDETALLGDFDVDVSFDATSGRAIASTAPTTGPSIFTAMSDLGLKVDAITAPVAVIVIDHVEQPTED